MDPRQRLINTRTKQRADPVWKLGKYGSQYAFVDERGETISGKLRGFMQKIPFELGEEVRVAFDNCNPWLGGRRENQDCLAAAARRVREWLP